MRKISFFIDGHIIEQEIPDDFGYFSILQVCEGMISELFEHPPEPENYVEHDG